MAQTEHDSYMENSPTYAQAFESYGVSMPEATAARFIQEHGFTLADMRAEGLTVRKGNVQTLQLFQVLGY